MLGHTATWYSSPGTAEHGWTEVVAGGRASGEPVQGRVERRSQSGIGSAELKVGVKKVMLAPRGV